MTEPSRHRGITGRSLRSVVGRAFIAALVLYLLLSGTVLVSLLIFRDKGDEVIDRWQPAYVLSVSALDDLVNQETGIRGYALSGQVSSIQPYTEYTTLFRTHVDAMRARIGDDAALQADLDAFLASAQSWRDTYAKPFIARIRAQDPTVAQAVGSAGAKDSFDAIRRDATKLSTDLRTIREEYKADRVTAATVVYYFMGGAAVLVLAMGVLLWRGLRRAVLEPAEQLAEQTRAVADGDISQSITATGPSEFEALGDDINAMRARIVNELVRVETARAELLARTDDLARSNADLEQFAYIASHDLSEPLRKVANFCQLLERQYADQLDEKAKTYIDFAVDGAKRMQVLINDLLAFSRVGRTTDEFGLIDLDGIAFRALANLDQRITETDTQVSYEDLPSVPGDPSLLTALFQNLIGNSVKYRSPEPPRIEITAEAREGFWLFTFTDNGIGIEAKYADKIFAIFQRLHLRDQYGGTGIGLALCRKIVEFHGGRIWLAENDGPGARFQFTLAADGGARPDLDATEVVP